MEYHFKFWDIKCIEIPGKSLIQGIQTFIGLLTLQGGTATWWNSMKITLYLTCLTKIASDWKTVVKNFLSFQFSHFLKHLLIFFPRNLTQLSRVRDWRHLSSNKSIRDNLISQLSKDQLNAIYENYKIDFEMFNYTMDKYFHWMKINNFYQNCKRSHIYIISNKTTLCLETSINCQLH